MNEESPEEAERRRAAAEQEQAETERGAEDGPTGHDKFPSETIHAVPVDDVTCGIDVTLFDGDEIDFPPAVRIEENWPAEDNREAESVMIHGGRDVMRVVEAMVYLFSERFDDDPWPDT